MALGADPGDVLKLVVGHGLRLTLMGIAIGLAGAFVLTRLMSSLLVPDQCHGSHRVRRERVCCSPPWRCWPAICRLGALRGSIRRMPSDKMETSLLG